MESADVIKLIWVIIFFFSVIVLFFVWAKSVVIIRLFVRVKELLRKMNELYSTDAGASEEKSKK